MVAKQKILIVDDDNNIAELISLYLTKECYECQIVNDGEEALKAFSSFQPNNWDIVPRDSSMITIWISIQQPQATGISPSQYQ